DEALRLSTREGFELEPLMSRFCLREKRCGLAADSKNLACELASFAHVLLPFAWSDPCAQAIDHDRTMTAFDAPFASANLLEEALRPQLEFRQIEFRIFHENCGLQVPVFAASVVQVEKC